MPLINATNRVDIRPRSGFRGRRTCAGLGRGFGGIETLGQARASAGGGVPVDRALARNAIEDLGGLAKLGFGLGKVAGRQSNVKLLGLRADVGLAGAVASAGLEILTDAFLGGKRMSHVGYLSANRLS